MEPKTRHGRQEKTRYRKLIHLLEYNNRNKREVIPDYTIQQFRAEITCYHNHSHETAKQVHADTTKIYKVTITRHTFETDEQQSSVKNEFI